MANPLPKEVDEWAALDAQYQGTEPSVTPPASSPSSSSSSSSAPVSHQDDEPEDSEPEDSEPEEPDYPDSNPNDDLELPEEPEPDEDSEPDYPDDEPEPEPEPDVSGHNLSGPNLPKAVTPNTESPKSGLLCPELPDAEGAEDQTKSHTPNGPSSVGAAGGYPPAALSSYEARGILFQRFNQTVGEGDPVLLLVEILREAHERQIALSNWARGKTAADYSEANAFLSETAAKIVQDMRAQSSAGAADAITAGLTEIAKEAGGLTEMITSFRKTTRSTIRRLITVLSLLTFLMWAAVASMYFVVQ